MFRFWLDSDYRKLYTELQSMQLFSASLPIKISSYQQYFHHLVIVDPSITQQLAAIPLDKLTPVRVVKIMSFLHCWLQATCVIEDDQPVLTFINSFLSQIQELVAKTKKYRRNSQNKMTQSTLQNKSSLRFQQLQWSKQLYLLEDVCLPYLYYLQQLISKFDFYNSLKKNFIKAMNQSEIWVLVNLFHSIGKVMTNVPNICKFIRKSYRSIAEALATVFSQDLTNFYPKLYKYTYGEISKIRSLFFEVQNEKGQTVAYKRCADQIDLISNLSAQIAEINKTICSVFDQPVIQSLYNVYAPKTIDTQGSEFEFVRQLEMYRKEGVLHTWENEVTPKFPTVRIKERTLRTEQDKEGLEMPVANSFFVFRDISNQDGGLSVPVRKREKGDRLEEEREKGRGRQHRRAPTLGHIQFD